MRKYEFGVKISTIAFSQRAHLLWAKLGRTRYGSLKYKMQIPSIGVGSLHGVVELLTLSRCVLFALFIKCSGNLFLFSV